jgi:hypothetical protein
MPSWIVLPCWQFCHDAMLTWAILQCFSSLLSGWSVFRRLLLPGWHRQRDAVHVHCWIVLSSGVVVDDGVSSWSCLRCEWYADVRGLPIRFVLRQHWFVSSERTLQRRVLLSERLVVCVSDPLSERLVLCGWQLEPD